MAKSHILGFPRIGAKRELKQAVEGYWAGRLDAAGLHEVAIGLQQRHWALQRQAGLNFICAGDFAYYDQVLNTSVMLGAVPSRFQASERPVSLDTMFRMARGRAPTGIDASACEMTKWFDTNYHYLVPEFYPDQRFALGSEALFDEIAAAASGAEVKPVLLGPVSYLWLGKEKQGAPDRLRLLEALLPVYRELLSRCGTDWVQIDEPALVLDLPVEWRNALQQAYRELAEVGPKLLLATYFGGLRENLGLALDLPVAGLHIDAVRAPELLDEVATGLGSDRVLSAGVVNGRNVWRTDCSAVIERLQPLHEQRGDQLWVAPSCSLLHCPVDLESETGLDDELREWLSFATQKLDEVQLIASALSGTLTAEGRECLTASDRAKASREQSVRTRNPLVRERLAGLQEADFNRTADYQTRRAEQREHLALPLYPTTTIGSFPQTPEIRKARAGYRSGRLTEQEYRDSMHSEISQHIAEQEVAGLDVLVHGEAERNDMVEYFGELLQGCAVTRFGWVQSYGSRCVKPPIIYGDVLREQPMTVEWIGYARSLTSKPVKGMLTGPVTMLCWSFVRDDQPLRDTASQLALAIRDEVADLECAGINIIQVDEPALREGLPLRHADWAGYLDWAVRSFRLSVGCAASATQVHTHMCYSEFNDIMDSIVALDADVITIETSRSDMELLDAFVRLDYPNEIGPGVYDIHSPIVPEVGEIVALLRLAAERLPHENLWVNPDCGLKTRSWEDVRPALRNMVEAARQMREDL